MKTFDVREFIDQITEAKEGDYAIAFKLLGFVVYIAQEGSDSLLTGNMISQRTYYRWLEIVKRAGWGDLLADARLRHVIKEYLHQKFSGLPIKNARMKVMEAVASMVGEVKAPSLQAKSRQASDAVKGERSESEGHEAQPSALDGDATGGSMKKAMAPNVLERTPGR